MTDVAEALAASQLTPYCGHEVVATGIEIPGAGGGLHDALAFDPMELGFGERVFVVIEVEKVRDRHEPIKGNFDAEGRPRLKLIQIVKPVGESGGMFIDGEVVREQMEAQRERTRIAREKAAGIDALDFDGAGGEDGSDGDPAPDGDDDWEDEK